MGEKKSKLVTPLADTLSEIYYRRSARRMHATINVSLCPLFFLGFTQRSKSIQSDENYPMTFKN